MIDTLLVVQPYNFFLDLSYTFIRLYPIYISSHVIYWRVLFGDTGYYFGFYDEQNKLRLTNNQWSLRKPISVMFKIKFTSYFLVIKKENYPVITRKDLVITRKI